MVSVVGASAGCTPLARRAGALGLRDSFSSRGICLIQVVLWVGLGILVISTHTTLSVSQETPMDLAKEAEGGRLEEAKGAVKVEAAQLPGTCLPGMHTGPQPSRHHRGSWGCSHHFPAVSPAQLPPAYPGDGGGGGSSWGLLYAATSMSCLRAGTCWTAGQRSQRLPHPHSEHQQVSELAGVTQRLPVVRMYILSQIFLDRVSDAPQLCSLLSARPAPQGQQCWLLVDSRSLWVVMPSKPRWKYWSPRLL